MGVSSYYTSDLEGMVAVGVVAIVLLIYLAVIGLGIGNYIMTSAGLHKLASRRQIANPWMAWLPFASDWIIGSIVDDYDGRNGIKRKWRVVLLTLSLISVVGLLVVYVVMFAYIFVMALRYEYAEPPVGELIGFILSVYLFTIIVSMVAVAQSFCKAICIFKIFESTVPQKAVKYLLLYLLVPLAGAICLLKCKDKGYPEPQASAVPVEPVPQYIAPVVEPTPEVISEPTLESETEPVAEQEEQSE